LLNIKKTILITGGTGLIGRHLCRRLDEKGYIVALLSRNKISGSRYPVFLWNPQTGEADPVAFKGISGIIHLAGAGIGDQRWSERRKKEIIDSRVNSAMALLKEVKQQGIALKTFISSSATGYYGAVTSGRIFTEEDKPSDDFLGTTCRLWEEAADRFSEAGARVVKIRTGIVLSREGGALPKMILPVKFGISTVPGNGKQWLPWIHLQDLCDLYVKVLEDNSLSGAYNAVAPEPVSMKEFMKEAAKALKRPFLPFPVPAFILKTMLGEMASLLTEGSRVSSEKIRKAGFEFRFPLLKETLHHVFKNG
jgi:uncharacterized protein